MLSPRRLLLALSILGPLCLAPVALAANAFPGVGVVSYDEGANALTLMISNGGRQPLHVAWLDSPYRLVVDVGGHWLPSARSMFIGNGVVTNVRASRMRNGVTRLVFSLGQAADLRSNVDLRTGMLVLTIFSKGARMMAQQGVPGALPTPRVPGTGIAMVPRYGAMPDARPTRRPIPERPGYTDVPMARITPYPYGQASYQPEPTMPYATPMSVPSMTPMPPIAMPSNFPTPEPLFTPEPLPPDVGMPNFGTSPPGIFGSRVSVGTELPLGLKETYPAGNSDSSIGLIPGAVFGWDQMFTPNIGIGVSGRAMSYQIQDDVAKEGGFQLLHKRDDYEGAFGLRSRFLLGDSLEILAQPGFLLRTTQVNSTVVPLVDGKVDGTPVNSAVVDYLSSGWLGYGAGMGLGVGYHVGGPLAVAGTGEVNYLFGGSMSQTGVTSIFPLLGYRAGLEAQLTFGWFGLSAGYNLTSYSNGTIGLNQSWNGPVLKLNVVY